VVGLEQLDSPRSGHFLLESGYHSDTWLDLDALFVDSAKIAPRLTELAERLRGYQLTAICGPLLGGAFLAHGIAHVLGVDFLYTVPAQPDDRRGILAAEYRLPPSLRDRVRGQRVAVVDDVISAGSSVRATIEAIAEARATTVVAAALLVLGDTGENHLAARGVPLEALDRRAFAHWLPEECPRCRNGEPLEDRA
jgi:orotate phosphoribosyltransferase